MKKNLFILCVGLFMSISACAQWNSNTEENNLITDPSHTSYGCIVETNPNGVSFSYNEIPTNPIIQTRLQIIDKEGYKLFEDQGKLVSNEPTLSWTLVGQRIFIDNDCNAILAVNDQRTGGYGYTLYKYDEKGNEIWGNVQVNNANPLKIAFNISICQTTDGGYVVAYTANENTKHDDENCFVIVEKFSKEGKKVWDDALKIGNEEDVRYAVPYLVDAGYNQCILVYAKGANQDLMARLIDFDGSSAWDEDLVVYNGGGWGTIPLYVMMNVKKGPDNGAVVTWWDGRNNVNYQNCISYITNTGTYGFSTGIEGTIISNSENYSRQVPDIYYDNDEKAIYCVYEQFLQNNQGICGIYMQKISFDGELLWGPNGKAVVEIQGDNEYAFCNIRRINKDGFAVFYQEKEGHATNGKTNSYMRIYDKNGTAVSEPYNFTTNEFEKSGLHVSELIDDKYFLADWSENRTSLYGENSKRHSNRFMQYLDYESVLSGIEEVNTEVNGRSIINTEIYSVDGKKHNNYVQGINIIRTVDSDGKIITEKITK